MYTNPIDRIISTFQPKTSVNFLSFVMQGIIELILATDMAKHGEYMEKYKDMLTAGFDAKNEHHVNTVS